jgi:hypothetical protein
MAKPSSPPETNSIRDVAAGPKVIVRGAGALKGRLRLDKSIDLTRPIASQVITTPGSRKNVKRRKDLNADAAAFR